MPTSLLTNLLLALILFLLAHYLGWKRRFLMAAKDDLITAVNNLTSAVTALQSNSAGSVSSTDVESAVAQINTATDAIKALTPGA